LNCKGSPGRRTLIDNIAAAILCGGKASRMKGLDKAFALFQGKPLIEYPLQLCKSLFSEIIIVGNQKKSQERIGRNLLFVQDFYKDCGPMAGIHSGLKKTKKEAVFFFSCDTPFLSEGIVRDLISNYRAFPCDILVPAIKDYIEPLCGIYKKGLEGEIERLLLEGKGYSVRRLFQICETRYLSLEDTWENRRAFININTLKDLEGFDEGEIP